MPPSVNDPYHRALEQDVKAWFHECGFMIESATYHDAMTRRAVDRLSSIDTPSSLYVRGREDYVAIHKTNQVCLLWEAKTGGKNGDLCIEALPLAHHVLLARNCGIDCLYVHRSRPPRGDEAGFYVSDCPKINIIRIPPRYSSRMKMWIRDVCDKAWPGIYVIDTDNTDGGSDDAFAVIASSQRRKSPIFDWRHEIHRLSEQDIVVVCNGATVSTSDDVAVRLSANDKQYAWSSWGCKQ